MQWTTNRIQPRHVRRWVAATGSLSARLSGAGRTFTVQVLNQGRQGLDPDEARALGLAGRCSGYVREVLLRVDQLPVVFARSVTPHAASQGPWRSIRGLGTRPLADVLFRRRGIARAPLEFARFTSAGPVRRNVTQAWQQAAHETRTLRAVPARRSVFTRCGAPLLVMEAFPSAQAPWHWSAGGRKQRNERKYFSRKRT